MTRSAGRSTDAPSPVSRAADARIVYLIRRAERAIRARLDVIVRQHGLTTPQYTTLSVLKVRDGLSSAQLARRAFVTPQAMNEIIIKLERDGLIQRYTTPAHRKTLHCELTPKGSAIFDACDRDCADIEALFVAGMDADEISHMRALLSEGIESLAVKDRRRGGSRPG
ncbi:MarR family transcriptional regulator [Streptomyces sp. NPDC029041]|uniref:MarR family winged helix-turn-helix transcriptional regulator n=1 Tax=Streptomyces sp. NPDC029041 TaxID=3155727 RepID=UPI00340B8BE5